MRHPAAARTHSLLPRSHVRVHHAHASLPVSRCRRDEHCDRGRRLLVKYSHTAPEDTIGQRLAPVRHSHGCCATVVPSLPTPLRHAINQYTPRTRVLCTATSSHLHTRYPTAQRGHEASRRHHTNPQPPPTPRHTCRVLTGTPHAPLPLQSSLVSRTVTYSWTIALSHVSDRNSSWMIAAGGSWRYSHHPPRPRTNGAWHFVQQ